MGYVANTNNNEFTIPTKNNQKKSMIQLNQEPAPTVTEYIENKKFENISSATNYINNDIVKEKIENDKNLKNISISSIL